jgi:tight adherence protein B
MLTPFVPAAIILLLVACVSAALLVRDVNGARLRDRVASIRTPAADPVAPVRLATLHLRSTNPRSKPAARIMEWLRLNPDIVFQNVVAWKLMIVMACAVALIGFVYGRVFMGWPLAALATPIETLLLLRWFFGWERERYQKAMLQQIPEVMALICRAVAAGIPLTEGLRSVAREAPSPSREEFMNVVNAVAIGEPLERSLWKLHARVGLPEYAFFAVTIGLQTQTGGSMVETLQNLQDLVRKRVALSKRGKALAAEARMSAMVLGGLPFVMGLVMFFVRPGFLDFFLRTPTGNHLLLGACGLMGTGIMTMGQMIRRSLAP